MCAKSVGDTKSVKIFHIYDSKPQHDILLNLLFSSLHDILLEGRWSKSPSCCNNQSGGIRIAIWEPSIMPTTPGKLFSSSYFP